MSTTTDPPGKGKKEPQRSPDMTTTSISLRKDLLEKGRAEAARKGRSFSNWLNELLRDRYEMRSVSDPGEESH